MDGLIGEDQDLEVDALTDLEPLESIENRGDVFPA